MGVLATIVAVAEAIKAVCALLISPEGQAAMALCRENTAALESRIALIGQWFDAQLKLARAA